MVLYHTGFDIIKNPDLTRGRKNSDFGPGFYLSPDRDFSFRWAKSSNQHSTYVNEYSLDEDELNILKFSHDDEWFDFITKNRKGAIQIPENVDVIIGPIANDTLYETFGILTSGLVDREAALKVLKYGNHYTQVVIKTPKALSQLTWTSATMLAKEQLDEYASYIKEENDKFQEYLTNTLNLED